MALMNGSRLLDVCEGGSCRDLQLLVTSFALGLLICILELKKSFVDRSGRLPVRITERHSYAVSAASQSFQTGS